MGSKKILKNIFILLLHIFRVILTPLINIINKGPNEPLVPIREDCLLDSASGIAARIRKRKITSVETVQACIRRIKETKETLNAVAYYRFDEAVKEAQAIDNFLAKKEKLEEEIERDTPFLGVPFTFADCIPFKDFPQSYGSYLLKNHVANEDAKVIMLMKKAGAVALASTNVPEMMVGGETNNVLFGKTRNPYHSKYMVGGTSGGEAALLSAAGSLMGIGFDAAGSFQIPSHLCGIFAHTLAFDTIVPQDLFKNIKLESNFRHGFMCKMAADLKPLLKVLSDNDKRLNLESSVDIKKLRFYYIDRIGNNSFTDGVEPVDKSIKEAIASIKNYFYKKYCIVVNEAKIEGMKDLHNIYWENTLRTDELAERIGTNWKKSIFLKAHQFMKNFQRKADLSDKELLEKKKEDLAKELKDLLADDGVLFFPTLPTPAVKHYGTLLRPMNLCYSSVINATKMTVTQCPIAQTEEGLPIGIQIVVSPLQDRNSIAVAEELEKAFGGWKPPPSQLKW